MMCFQSNVRPALLPDREVHPITTCLLQTSCETSAALEQAAVRACERQRVGKGTLVAAVGDPQRSPGGETETWVVLGSGSG